MAHALAEVLDRLGRDVVGVLLEAEGRVEQHGRHRCAVVASGPAPNSERWTLIMVGLVSPEPMITRSRVTTEEPRLDLLDEEIGNGHGVLGVQVVVAGHGHDLGRHRWSTSSGTGPATRRPAGTSSTGISSVAMTSDGLCSQSPRRIWR